MARIAKASKEQHSNKVASLRCLLSSKCAGLLFRRQKCAHYTRRRQSDAQSDAQSFRRVRESMRASLSSSSVVLSTLLICVIVVAAARAASFPFSTTLHSMSVAVDASVVSWNSNVDRNCCSRHNLTLYTLQNISCVYVYVCVRVCVRVLFSCCFFVFFLWYDKLPLLSALIIPKKKKKIREKKSITNTLLAGKTFAFACVLILWRCGW